MIKHFLTVYLPAMVVITTASVAGVFLYRDNDPQLEQVEFVESEDRIAESTEQTEDLLVQTGTAEEVESLKPLNSTEDAEVQEITSNSDVTTIQALPQDIVDEPTVGTQLSIATVTISGPGVSKRCEVEVTDTIKAHALMKQAAQQCGFSYVWKNYPSLGVFVEELAGVQSNKTKGKYWIYYVNAKKANVGISSYTVVPGDLLAWQFEQEY